MGCKISITSSHLSPASVLWGTEVVETQGTQGALKFRLSLQPVAQPVWTSEEWEKSWGCAQRKKVQISSVQLLSRVRLFATPRTAARQASLSLTNSWSSPKLMCIGSVIPSSHLIFCRPLLLLPPIPPSIKVFSNESTLHMRWSKYWSFSFSISPSKEHPGLISSAKSDNFNKLVSFKF